MQARFDEVMKVENFKSEEEQLLAMDKLQADDAFRKKLGENTFWQQILTEKYKELINSVAQKHLFICSTIAIRTKDLAKFSENSSPDTLYSRYAQKQMRTQILNEQDPLTRSIITERWIATLGRSYELGNMQALPVIANEFNGGAVGRLNIPVSQHATNFLKVVNDLSLAGSHLSPITRLTDLRYDLAIPLISIFLGKFITAKEKISSNRVAEWNEKYDLFLEVMKEFHVKDDKLVAALEALKVRAADKKDVTYLSDYDSLWNTMVKKIDTNITLLEKIENSSRKNAVEPSLRSKLVEFESRLSTIDTKFVALLKHNKNVVAYSSEFLEKLRQRVTVKKGFLNVDPEMVTTDEAVKLDDEFKKLSYGILPKGTPEPGRVVSPHFSDKFSSIVFPESAGEFYASSLSKFLSLITEKFDVVRNINTHYADEVLAKSGKDSLSIHQQITDVVRYCSGDNILDAKDMLSMINKLLEHLQQDPNGNASHYQKSAENLLKETRKKTTAEKPQQTKQNTIQDLTVYLKRLKDVYQSIDAILKEMHVRNPEPKITVKIAPSEDLPSTPKRSTNLEKDSINELRQALKPIIVPRSKQKAHEDSHSPYSSGSVTPSSGGRQRALSIVVPTLRGSKTVSGETTPVLSRDGSTICLSPQLTNRSDSSLNTSPAPSPVVETRRRASLSSTKNLLTDSSNTLFRFTPQLANLQAEEVVSPLTPPILPIAASDLPTPPIGASPPIRPRGGTLARNIGIRDLAALRESANESQTPKPG